MDHLYIPYKGKQFRDIEHAKRGINVNYDDGHVDKTVNLLTKILKFQSNDIVLDIGSGIGDISKALADKVSAIHCCDVNEQYLCLATENCKDVSNIQFHLIEDPLVSLAFLPDNSITKGFANLVLIHNCTEVVVGYLKELKRVLKPNGLFTGNYCVTNRDWDNRPHIVESDKNIIDETLKDLDFTILNNEIREYQNTVNYLVIRK